MKKVTKPYLFVRVDSGALVHDLKSAGAHEAQCVVHSNKHKARGGGQRGGGKKCNTADGVWKE